MKKAFLFLVLIIFVYAGILLIQLSISYLKFNSAVDFLKTKQLIYHIKHWRWSFYIHVFVSPLLYFSGVIQFIPFIYNNYPKIHKTFGKIYIINLLIITGPAALIMSFYANGSYPAQVSFVLLSLFWMVTTLKAYLAVRKRDIDSHIDWMTRSMFLTLSAVTLRFYALMLDVLHLVYDPLITYVCLAWLSWIPNLIMAELLIRKKIIKKYFKILD